jgi:Golgi nucleoside diphosphatase
MFKIPDFAAIFCTSERTINRRLKKLTPILKKFDTRKRKHFYSLEEAKYIINQIGIPPNNEFNRQLKANYPNLF